MYIQCRLCPHQCRIAPGERGSCRIRVNIGGVLRAITYGRPCTVHVDPIEKKPFFHFYPGSKALSLATAGCNLHCKNCQNWEISQADPEDIPAYTMEPADVVALAAREQVPVISFTYTDPAAYFEYAYDTCAYAHHAGIKTTLITAGYINQEPLKKILPFLDAIKIDLKFFDDALYQDITTGTLQPVLDTIVTAKKMGVWVEVVNLVIPTLNDDAAQMQKMCSWLAAYAGVDTPLHFSRFYPQYKLRNLPLTPFETLRRAKAIAQDAGMQFVYIGNTNRIEEETTYCPHDGSVLVRRAGFTVTEYNLDAERCTQCGNMIPGRWPDKKGGGA